jgi:hypothetical protein
MSRAVGFALALLLPLASAGAQEAQDPVLAKRPAFSLGDQPAQSYARCDELRRMSADLPDDLQFRIDLSITGELTSVRTDGALWYLTMCGDVRIMCVTYESNEMKTGERVFMKGGYRRLDANHALLDPCLAHRDELEK